uniref:Uncharacterized protein n=1 Tax=Anopheles merus TaxID=30066 RepID=A0A182VD34_ANOME
MMLLPAGMTPLFSELSERNGSSFFDPYDGDDGGSHQSCLHVKPNPTLKSIPIPNPIPNPRPNPEPNPEPRPDPNPEPNPGPILEPNPEPNPDPKPEPNPDPNPDPNLEPNPPVPVEVPSIALFRSKSDRALRGPT